MGQDLNATICALFSLIQTPDALVCPHQCTADNLPTSSVVVVIFVVTPAELVLKRVGTLLPVPEEVEIVAGNRDTGRSKQHQSGGQQQVPAGQYPDGPRHGASAFAHWLLSRGQPVPGFQNRLSRA